MQNPSMSDQEQPEDHQSDDGQPDDGPSEPDNGPSEPDDGPREEERIEQITERIHKARAQAEEAGVLDDAEDQEKFAESGATEEEDDQTIAPPG